MGRKKKILVRRNWDNFRSPLLADSIQLNDTDQSVREHEDTPCLLHSEGVGSQRTDSIPPDVAIVGESHPASETVNLSDINGNGYHGGVAPGEDEVDKPSSPVGQDQPDIPVVRNISFNYLSDSVVSNYGNGNVTQTRLIEGGGKNYDEIVKPAFKRHQVIVPSEKPIDQVYSAKKSDSTTIYSKEPTHSTQTIENHQQKPGKKTKKESKKRKSRDEPPFTCFDALVNIISIGSYLADIGSDIFIALLYFRDGHWAWFSLTLVFILLPAVINTCFSIVWYVQDGKYYRESGAKVSVLRWVIRVIFLVFQIGPILRYIDATIYGCKSMRHRKSEKHTVSKYYQDMMYNEDSDAAYLRLMECFMEAAPQLTLQLYILCKHGAHQMLLIKIGQSAAIVTSLASLAWALTSYHRSLRFSLPEKANLGYIGMGLQFVWRFFTVGARVLAMSLFATCYGYWIFVFCGCHWFMMFVWIVTLRTTFCNTKCLEMLFNAVMATVYIFCFVNVAEGHTRLKYLLYYTVTYIENMGLIVGWYIFAHTETIWYLEPSLTMVLGGFFLGIFFQVIYYVFFHPNNYPPIDQSKRIAMWVPCHVLCGCQEGAGGQGQDENMNNVSGEQAGSHGVEPSRAPRDPSIWQYRDDTWQQREHDPIVTRNQGQMRVIELSKHHQPHPHQTLV